MRHAQGEPIKGDFELTRDNIDEYLNYAVKMDTQIRKLNMVNDLKYKLEHLDSIDDELYTEDYLKRRLDKIMTELDTDTYREITELKQQLLLVNKDIDVVRPLVFDMEEGKKPENHARMSDLDDNRKRLEEEINDYYGRKFPKLKEHLPKVYYMVLEGVDMDTVKMCFRKMKMVLTDQITTEDAANDLMDASTTKYNLPTSIYDPIRNRTKSKGKKGKGK
jgi:hypothetical protein